MSINHVKLKYTYDAIFVNWKSRVTIRQTAVVKTNKYSHIITEVWYATFYAMCCTIYNLIYML